MADSTSVRTNAVIFVAVDQLRVPGHVDRADERHVSCGPAAAGHLSVNVISMSTRTVLATPRSASPSALASRIGGGTTGTPGKGGIGSLENVILLCTTHNSLAAQVAWGEAHMERFRKPRKTAIPYEFKAEPEEADSGDRSETDGYAADGGAVVIDTRPVRSGDMPVRDAHGRLERHVNRDYSYVRGEVIRIVAIAGFLVIALFITSLFR